jgi:hypothetical protein
MGCGRKRKKRIERAESPRVLERPRSSKLGGKILGGTLLILLAAITGWGFFLAKSGSDAKSNPTSISESATSLAGVSDELPLVVPTAAKPASLEGLLSLSTEELGQVDIARVNLLVAKGLPGTEQIDLDECAAELDRWAKQVRFETERHFYQFYENPAEYEHSEGYFRMLLLVSVLQQQFGVHYNPDRIREIDFSRSADLFIHGLIPSAGKSKEQTNGGTCVSMPVLYTAIARRLEYPVKLVHTRAHVFCRWDAVDHPRDAWRGRFNIEATNRGLSCYSDEYYKTWPAVITEAEVQAHGHLQSLTAAQELA